MSQRGYGLGWVALCLALILHVYDEAVNNFLVVYNPTAMAIRDRVPWLPIPVYQYEVWLGGLMMGCLVLLALSVFAFNGVRWLRPVAYALAVIMILNAAGHIAGTIFGQSLFGLRFARPMPGFWSSPALIVSAIWLLVQLRRTAAPAAACYPLPQAAAHPN